VPRAGIARLIGVALGALVAVVFSVPAVAGAAQGPTQLGPAQINAAGRPDLCWQAAGNGSPVTLEHCDSAVQGQQWALTGGVLMNGNGYCLEAGTGPALFIGFNAQCGGGSGQLWTFSRITGHLSSRGGTGCAAVNGSLVPGTAVVRGSCGGGARWSFGDSAVHQTAPQPGTAPARPPVAGTRVAGAVVAGAAASGPAAGQGGSLRLAALLAGVLLVGGGVLVFVGRRSRRQG
jgi:hypothetical protein